MPDSWLEVLRIRNFLLPDKSVKDFRGQSLEQILCW